MSFREKSAWITLITLIVLALFFVTHLPPPSTISGGGWFFHVLAIGVIAFVVIEIIAHIVVAARAPKDARAPQDERERLIALKAANIGAYAYAVLSLSSVFIVVHLGANAIGVAYCVFLSFVIAEVINYAARVWYYRRGV